MMIIKRHNDAGLGSNIVTMLESCEDLNRKNMLHNNDGSCKEIYFDFRTSCYNGFNISSLLVNDSQSKFQDKPLIKWYRIGDWYDNFDNRNQYILNQINREKYHLENFLKIKPELYESDKILIDRYDLKNHIAVYFRGSDKKTESRRNNINDYVKVIKILDDKILSSGDKIIRKLYIQSDEQWFYTEMRKIFGNRITDITLFSRGNGTPLHYMGQSALETFSIMNCLASTPYLICCRSNVSHVAIILRPDGLENTYYVEDYLNV